MKVKKILVGLGLAVVLVLGWIQLSADAKADRPITNCAAVLCVPCPDGYVLAPTPGNCCRCVKAH